MGFLFSKPKKPQPKDQFDNLNARKVSIQLTRNGQYVERRRKRVFLTATSNPSQWYMLQEGKRFMICCAYENEILYLTPDRKGKFKLFNDAAAKIVTSHARATVDYRKMQYCNTSRYDIRHGYKLEHVATGKCIGNRKRKHLTLVGAQHGERFEMILSK